jgi:hypothetical protein
MATSIIKKPTIIKTIPITAYGNGTDASRTPITGLSSSDQILGVQGMSAVGVAGYKDLYDWVVDPVNRTINCAWSTVRPSTEGCRFLLAYIEG